MAKIQEHGSRPASIILNTCSTRKTSLSYLFKRGHYELMKFVSGLPQLYFGSQN